MLQAQAFDFSQACFFAAPLFFSQPPLLFVQMLSFGLQRLALGTLLGEYFCHANFKSPKLLRYFIQTPELNSIHHQLDVHDYDYSDLPIWDRIIGTYKGTTEFMPECGFPGDNEEHLVEMIAFKDVYEISRS